MTNLSNNILLDSNILIYMLNPNCEQYTSAATFVDLNQHRLLVAQQSLAEYLRIALHPSHPIKLTVEQMDQNVSKWISAAQQVICPNPDTLDVFMRLIKKHQISGRTIFDTYLTATALTNGVSNLATFNAKDFQQFSSEGISIISLA